jgi:hypothetical protein
MGAGRVRNNVGHGVQVADNEIYDMADKIATSDSVRKTLSALNFEPVNETRETVQEKIEQAAFTTAEGYDDVSADYSVFDADEAAKATEAADMAVPPETYGGDEGGDGSDGGNGGSSQMTDFFADLLSGDD